jgi:uncharacterized phage infection (PIP) family protein YhgE
MAKFPNEIWTGLTRTRHDLDSTTPPDHSDWMALLGEIQAMQRYILNLSGSMEAMPNITESIKETEEKIQDLLGKLKRLAPPVDLQAELVGLQRRVVEIDVREDHDRLRSGFKKLFLRTRNMEKAYKDLKEDVYYQLEVLTNSVRNQLQKLRQDMETRHESLQEQIKELQDVLVNPELD